MTRKHFEALAAALRGTRPFPGDSPEAWDQWRATVRAVTDTCYQFNGQFNRDRFERAAGFDR